MLRLKRGQYFLTIAAGLSAAGARTWAVDASDVLVYSIGPVRVRPHLAVSEQYDDNIFYRGSKSPPDPVTGLPLLVEDDFVSMVSPGVDLQLGHLDGNHIRFSYELNQMFYARHNDQDHRDHLLSLNTRLHGNRVSLEGSDSVQFLSGILGGGFSLQQGRVDRTAFLDHYRLGYTLSEKTSVYAEGSYDAIDYKEKTIPPKSTLYDSNTLRGTGGFAFHSTEKIRLFGEGYYGQSAVDPNRMIDTKGPHLDFAGGFLGASGEFTSKLSGSVKAGYETRSFSNSSSSEGSPVVEASLTEKINDKTTLSLSYSRRSAVSVQAASQSYSSDVSALAWIGCFPRTANSWPGWARILKMTNTKAAVLSPGAMTSPTGRTSG